MWMLPAVMVMVVVKGVHVRGGGEGEEGGDMSPTPIPSPPPQGQGVYSVLLKLQQKVDNMEELQEKDRTRLRRLDRRNRQYRDSMVTVQEDVVQLRQHVTELQERLSSAEELTTEARLDITRLDYEHRKTRTELASMKDRRPVQNDHAFEVQKNMSMLLTVKEDLFESYVSLMEEVQELREKSKENRKSISVLKYGYNKVVKVLRSHVGDEQQHVTGVESDESSESNETRIWTGDDTDSGDASGDITLETVPSKFDSSDLEGSGDPEIDSLFPIFPKLNTTSLASEVPELKARLLQLENKLDEKLDKVAKADLESRTDKLLKKHDSYFEQEIVKRDKDFDSLEEKLFLLSNKIHSVESRVLSIQLGDFMQKLQENLINFTQNVITLDQWKMASDQIINSTQFNQQQISQMTAMIMNNSRAVSQVDWKLTDQHLLSDQQYRVLRMHIIRLNNSMQDLREHVEYLGSIKSGSASSQVPGYAAPTGDVTSKIEDLALQIIYSENRIANMESKVLNQTVFTCQKSNKDMYQDTRLLHLEKMVSVLSATGALITEKIKRVDRALYRVHANSKNNTIVINKLWTKASMWQLYFPVINLVHQEVNNLLTRVPQDCDTYYKRGFVESGKYVIYPQGALQSVFVHCSMESNGGWTVIQQRTNGNVNFSRPWAEYAVGFGSADGEYWLGNEFLHLMTFSSNYTLRIEMTDIFNGFWFVEYSTFIISSKEENYKLKVAGYSGNATDGMDYSNDMEFSTHDNDNDLSSTHCALFFTSGWWYRHCQYSNLNGRYKTGIVWFNSDWQDWIEMKQTVMKLKPRS